jgi:hypothetical protein
VFVWLRMRGGRTSCVSDSSPRVASTRQLHTQSSHIHMYFQSIARHHVPEQPARDAREVLCAEPRLVVARRQVGADEEETGVQHL